MAEGVITVHYRWTAEQLSEATRWHQRHGTARRVRLVIYWVIIALAVGSAALSHASSRSGPFSWMGGGLIVYLLVLMGLRRFLVLWQVRRNYRKSAARDAEIAWHVSETTLQMNYVHGSSETRWTAFIKVVLTPDGLLLYPQPNLFHWLPSTGFASTSDFEAVVGMARRNVAAFKVLR